jgi:Domain of unknown function (DUF1844)
VSSEQGGERGFIVVDKRKGEEPEPAKKPEAGSSREESRSLPRPDFAALVISLGHSALYHLGLVPDPQTGQKAPLDRALARQTIDTIEMLEEKTRGNLTEDEAHLLRDLLYDLRARFVEVK